MKASGSATVVEVGNTPIFNAAPVYLGIRQCFFALAAWKGRNT